MPGPHTYLVDLYRQQFPNICYGLNEWRHYVEPGIWQPISEFLIRRALITIARTQDITTTAALISSAQSLLHDEVYVPAGNFDSNPDVIPLTNGVLTVATRELRLYTPTDYVTNSLPYAYDATATSTMWEQLLSQLDPESRDFLQEWTGLCNIPDTHHEIAVWLYGPPRGGKSTFIDGLQTMLGSKSSVLGLDEIARSPFALSQVVGKNLLVCTEQPADLLKYVHTYIKLISGEPITINPKHMPAFEYRPHAKLISAMNKLPTIDNAGVGLYRRLAPIFWPGVPDNKQNTNIKKLISTQGPAILNWALDGLDRLRARGGLIIPKAIEDARNLYKASYSNVMPFVEEWYDKAEDGRVRAADVRAAYELWCALNDEEPIALNKFSPEIDQWFRFVKPGNVKHWIGLAPKVDPNPSH